MSPGAASGGITVNPQPPPPAPVNLDAKPYLPLTNPHETLMNTRSYENKQVG
jgi:hypothetical protein